MILKKFSKKTLIALLLCSVALAGAVGAYAIMLNSQSGTSEPDFIFTWGPDEQNIVEGTFRLEVWITLEGENLTIIIKANDDDYSGYDVIGLVFDRNQNGIIDGVEFSFPLPVNLTEADEAYLLYVVGAGEGVWYEGDNCFEAFVETLSPPEDIGYTVTFDPKTGYTFDIRFPCPRAPLFSSGNPAQWLRKGDYNPIHLYFHDAGESRKSVSVRFHFYILEES